MEATRKAFPDRVPAFVREHYKEYLPQSHYGCAMVKPSYYQHHIHPIQPTTPHPGMESLVQPHTVCKGEYCAVSELLYYLLRTYGAIRVCHEEDHVTEFDVSNTYVVLEKDDEHEYAKISDDLPPTLETNGIVYTLQFTQNASTKNLCHVIRGMHDRIFLHPMTFLAAFDDKTFAVIQRDPCLTTDWFQTRVDWIAFIQQQHPAIVHGEWQSTQYGKTIRISAVEGVDIASIQAEPITDVDVAMSSKDGFNAHLFPIKQHILSFATGVHAIPDN
jgi:hypothetical protein